MRALATLLTTVSIALGLVGCGSRISEAERRQAVNRARLATSMLMEGELAAALREAVRATELDPECIDCRQTLATIYAARAEFDRAEETLLAILEDQPDNPFAHNTLASVYLNMGRPADAEAHARAASEDEEFAGRHLAFYNLGWSFQERQQYTEALNAYAQALRESPRMCLAHYRIGEVYFRQRRCDDALHHLEQAVAEPDEEAESDSSSERRGPQSCAGMPEAHYALALAMMSCEHQADALEEFRRCAELAPERSDLQRRCARQVEENE